MTKDDFPSARRRGIQSVEIGLKVLATVVAQQKPASLTSIAQSSGLSASQAHRYLRSLIASGMVRQEPASSLYDLDAGAVRLGLAALSRLNVLETADQILADYVRSTGRTAAVSVWGDGGPTIVRWYNGEPNLITSLHVGSILPLLRSDTGLIFYAFANPAQVDPHAALEAQRMGYRVLDFAATRRSIQETLIDSREGAVPGLRSAAAPVFDLQGQLALVATSLAGEPHAAKDDRSAHAALLSACRQLTESIGGVWPASPGL